MNRNQCSTLSCALVVLLAFAGGQPGVAQEVDVDVPCQAGVVEPLPLVFGSRTVGCALDTIVDIDTFSFEADAGTGIHLVVAGMPLGLDPSVTIFGPGGATYTGSCVVPSNQQCVLVINEVLDTSGEHVIVLSAVGSNQAGAYTLELQAWPPDNTLPLYFNHTLSTTLSPVTDHDAYTLEAVAGTLFRVTVSSPPLGLDPVLSVLDPDGNALPGASCTVPSTQVCSASVDIVPAESGPMTFVLHEGGHNQNGTVVLGVQCLLGPCACLAHDITGDGIVGISDFLELLADWGQCATSCPADLNGDGDVGIDDLLLLIASWGVCP